MVNISFIRFFVEHHVLIADQMADFVNGETCGYEPQKNYNLNVKSPFFCTFEVSFTILSFIVLTFCFFIAGKIAGVTDKNNSSSRVLQLCLLAYWHSYWGAYWNWAVIGEIYFTWHDKSKIQCVLFLIHLCQYNRQPEDLHNSISYVPNTKQHPEVNNDSRWLLAAKEDIESHQ